MGRTKHILKFLLKLPKLYVKTKKNKKKNKDNKK